MWADGIELEYLGFESNPDLTENWLPVSQKQNWALILTKYRVKPDPVQELADVMKERDFNHVWAEELAYCISEITGVDIGNTGGGISWHNAKIAAKYFRKKDWVGLTDTEINKATTTATAPIDWLSFRKGVECAEAKLKEKNA